MLGSRAGAQPELTPKPSSEPAGCIAAGDRASRKPAAKSREKRKSPCKPGGGQQTAKEVRCAGESSLGRRMSRNRRLKYRWRHPFLIPYESGVIGSLPVVGGKCGVVPGRHASAHGVTEAAVTVCHACASNPAHVLEAPTYLPPLSLCTHVPSRSTHELLRPMKSMQLADTYQEAELGFQHGAQGPETMLKSDFYKIFSRGK